MTDPIVYLSLFASAFFAATLLPGSSEAALVALLLAGRGEPLALLAVVTVGNVLGSAVNWACGRFLSHYRDRRWFPISPEHYARAMGWFQRWGRFSLLLAWVPIIGDPLTVAAGALRYPIAPFVALVSVGKLARYLAVYALTP
ncbi:MAG: YqaA family protein [Rhodospirillaceae bacterium]|nr:YqaA family protein [Rhodospirillaceae bacterium]